MEIKGKLSKVLPAQTGQKKNGGEWKKQGFVIELDGNPRFDGKPREVCFQVWSDKVNVDTLVTGSMINVFFDPESREFNEKWYTDLTAWKVETIGESQPTSPSMPSSISPFMPPLETYQPEEMGGFPMKDDLPF